MKRISDKLIHQVGHVGLQAVRGKLSPSEALMGLDSGKKRWGIAISDDALRVALPLVQYDRKKYAEDLQFLRAIIKERNIGGVIIGLPLHMNADPSPRAQAAIQLGKDIESRLSVAVAFWDERLSSVAMERAMVEEADLSRKKRQQSIDKLAASFILQGALDALKI